MKKLLGILAFWGIWILSSCSSTMDSVPLIATSSPQPPAQARILPTPSSFGDDIVWRDLQAAMLEIEITDSFITEYNSTRTPPAGMKFMWVRVQLKNNGREEIKLPLLENFSVLYADAEIKPIYGYRKGYAEYASLTDALFPNQQVNAWLRFDIPITASLEDLRFVFLPESASVGASFSSPNYPYADDKPTYVWKCAP